MQKLSRRTLAHYIADHTHDGVVSSARLQEVAAYLIEAGRVREIELVARAIEDELALRGTVVTDVVTAHTLTDAEKHDIQRLIAADTVYFREVVEPSVIGGVRVKTPGATLDATIEHKLQALKRAKL